MAERATRGLILQQLLNAFIYPKQQRDYVKKAVATYRYYQKQYPEEAHKAITYDNLEGSAYYFELMSCLYISYPDIKNIEDILEAYRLIAKDVDVTKNLGLVLEAYALGGLSGLLLDYYQDPVIWKQAIMQKTEATPLNQLAELFDKEITEKDIIKPDEAWLKKYEDIARAGAPVLSQDQINTMIPLLKDLKKDSPTDYEAMLEEIKKSNPTSYDLIIKQLQ